MYEEDLALAQELADIADAITMRYFDRRDGQFTEKSDRSLVSAADLEVEEALKSRLSQVRPADALIGEELGSGGRGPRRWIIDPLDHTNNFARGLPFFATLIALEVEMEVQVGVVTAPALKQRWHARRGGGAWRGNTQLFVSDASSFREAHFSYAAIDKWHELDRDRAILRLSQEARYEWGSGGWWAHMMVAEGKMDFSLDPWGHEWDIAAIQVVVEEAGGRLTDVNGERRIDGGTAIVTNRALNSAVLSALRK